MVAVGYQLSSYFLWFHTMPQFLNEALLIPWLFVAATLSRNPDVHWTLAVGALGLVVGGLLLGG